MGPAHQMSTILAQQLTRSAIERNGEVSAQVPVGHDGPGLVSKEKGHDGESFVVVSKLSGPHDADTELE